VTLDSWLLMAKGKIKPKRDEGAEATVAHSQSIFFLENSSTNAMYSSIMRRVNACIAECLRPNIKVNAQWSDEESEEWYNSIEPVRRATGKTYSYSSDSKAFDRSQDHLCLAFEMAFYRRLGLTGQRFDRWCLEHGSKRAMSFAFGIILRIVLCGISGDWKTLLRNGLIQLAANIISADIRREDIVTLEIKGDDMDGEFRRPLQVETAVDRMSLTFNLASKFNTNSVRYFCKKFRLKIFGRWVEVADPWVKVQSVCTPVWIDGPKVDMKEKWESLCSTLRHYDNEIVMTALAEATQQFYSLKIAPYGLCRALTRFKRDKNAYMGFFNPPMLIG